MNSQFFKTIVIGSLLPFIFIINLATAGLIDRGNGMIYDDVLDVTWLQNANLANKTMNWQESIHWADNLVFGGFDDWRLSTVHDVGDDGCNYSFSNTDCGYNSLTSNIAPNSSDMFFSELAYMFYENLNNIAKFDTNGNSGQAGWDTLNTSFIDAVTGDSVSFIDLKRAAYWSGTEYVPNTNRAWYFFTNPGSQSHYHKNSNFYAWALRDGDIIEEPTTLYSAITLPEPSSVTMFSLAILGMIRLKRNRKYFPKLVK